MSLIITRDQIREAIRHDPEVCATYVSLVNLIRMRRLTPAEVRAIAMEAALHVERYRTESPVITRDQLKAAFGEG